MVNEKISPRTSKEQDTLWGSILAAGVILGVVASEIAQIPFEVWFTTILSLVLAACAMRYGVIRT
jgi:hypothetical protein